MLALVEYPKTEVLRHLGRKESRRHFAIFINNVEIERLDEGSEAVRYVDGPQFIEWVERRVSLFERALAAPAERRAAYDYDLSQ